MADAGAFVEELLQRLNESVQMRIGEVIEVEPTGERRARLDITGALYWAATDSDSTLAPGDRVYALRQGSTWVVAGRLSGGSGTPVGSVIPWAGTSPTTPAGWLLADGAEVSRTTYAALFAVISTTYGAGNGSSTFRLPNLEGRFVFGDNDDRTVGSTGGSERVTLTEAQMPSHNHGSAGSHSHTMRSTITVQSGSGATVMDDTTGSTHDTGSSGTHTHGTNGSDQSHENMPPFIVMKYLIKVV